MTSHSSLFRARDKDLVRNHVEHLVFDFSLYRKGSAKVLK